MSAYDPLARTFEQYRALPQSVPEAIRAAVLSAFDVPQPRVLDLGAGTGRIGRPFAAADDDYVGVDLSLGMLREFAGQACADGPPPPSLVQADGELLPFRDSTFDAVMLVQVIGAVRNWSSLTTESRRVLRRRGALFIGGSLMPDDGLDAQMKRQLASCLEKLGVERYHMERTMDARHSLVAHAHDTIRVIATEWDIERTPRSFLERQPTGARFSKLPDNIKSRALHDLRTWAIATFGSLDKVFLERHAFELQIFRFD